MNLDNSNDESIKKNDIKFVKTFTKKNWFKLEKGNEGWKFSLFLKKIILFK